MANVIVSFPRSGQHFTEKLLRAAHRRLELPYSYCKLYPAKPKGSYCECSGCMRVPCANGCLFTKSHDFKLRDKLFPQHKFLVLYRKDPIKQLESFYRRGHKLQRINLSGIQRFASCSLKTMTYYNGFVSKWCDGTVGMKNVHVVEFYELMDDTASSFRGILKFFDIPIPDDLGSVLSEVPMTRVRFPEAYYKVLRSSVSTFMDMAKKE